MHEYAQRLRSTVAGEEPLMRAIPEDIAAAARGAGNWSPKEELGHLLDSAVNNRVRFVKAALEGRFDGPSYDAEGWVRLGGYAEMPWAGLLDLWKAMNVSLATVISRIPEERWTAECRVGESVATLEFIVDDYIQHMQHHLDHILAREHVRSYPGAKK